MKWCGYNYIVSKEIYIFISSVFLLLPILSLFEAVSISAQLIFCAPFILLIGIPHGAIDNMLYLREQTGRNTQFIAVYLLIIFANVALWLVMPEAAYISFLILSAYHFGQSQFSHYFKSQNLFRKSIFLSWGLSVLSALILFNLAEIQQLMIAYSEFAVFDNAHHPVALQSIFWISTTYTIFSLIYLVYTKAIDIEVLAMESLIMGLIFFAFVLMPLIVGFTLYFVILHSIKVLNEEFQFLQTEKQANSLLDFLKLLAPFSLLSFFGIGALFLTIHLEIFAISYGYCMLILISSITLPHVFVMNQFYRLVLGARLSQA